MIKDPEEFRKRTEELQAAFTYDDFEVSRGQLFSQHRLPAMTIRNRNITFNASCISELEDVVYVQILISRNKRQIAICACEANDKDAIRWCIAKPGQKRRSRNITSRIFSEKIYDLMEWEEGKRYRMLGHKIEHKGKTLFLFEMDEAEAYRERARKTKEERVAEQQALGLTDEQMKKREKEERRITRTPIFPESWQDSFGVNANEHHNVTLDDISGYGTYSDMTADSAAAL